MKIDRLFSIVQILVNKKTVTAGYLADYFQVSVRTIYRDIDILAANGIPIYSIKGKGGGISILDNYSIDKSLVTDEEQNQILMALHSVNATGQIDVQDSLIKLRNIFRKNNADWIEIDFSGWEQSNDEKENFEILKDSIINVKVVIFSYFNNKGEVSDRTIEPYKLVFKSNKWYLYGYCKMRKDFRFFKLTRMEDLKILQETFNRQDNILINTSYKLYKEELIKVKLKIDKCMASRVYDEFRKGIITFDGENFFIEIDIPQNEWVYSYFLGYEDSLEILEPLEMRVELIKRLEGLLQKYSKK